MATAGRTKINTNIEKGHFGPIPGVEVGQRWQYRIQLSELGVHAPPGEILVMFASQLGIFIFDFTDFFIFLNI